MLSVIFALLTVTSQDQSGQRPPGTNIVFYAILNGDWKQVDQLKKQIKSFKHPILESETEYSDVLTRLAATGDAAGKYANALTGIRICIEHGADPNERGGSPLAMAAFADAWGKMVERLLQAGANPNPSKNWSHLNQAITRHRVQNVRILLDYGTDPNSSGWIRPDQWRGYSRPTRPSGPMLPLSLAARRGEAEILQMSLKSGAKVNARDAHTGMTALHEAAEADQGAIVTLLLRARANRTIRDEKGRTPLNLARQAKARTSIRALGGVGL